VFCPFFKTEIWYLRFCTCSIPCLLLRRYQISSSSCSCSCSCCSCSYYLIAALRTLSDLVSVSIFTSIPHDFKRYGLRNNHFILHAFFIVIHFRSCARRSIGSPRPQAARLHSIRNLAGTLAALPSCHGVHIFTSETPQGPCIRGPNAGEQCFQSFEFFLNKCPVPPPFRLRRCLLRLVASPSELEGEIEWEEGGREGERASERERARERAHARVKETRAQSQMSRDLQRTNGCGFSKT